jgi:hypothetical protein
MSAVKMAVHIVSSGKSHVTLWTCWRHRRDSVEHVLPLLTVWIRMTRDCNVHLI